MPLKLPKQQITGAIAQTTVSASFAVPVQQVTAEVEVAAPADIGIDLQIPMQRIVGQLPEIGAPIAIPMQSMEGAMFQSVLSIPMQAVTADIAVPLVMDASFTIPMQRIPSYGTANIVGEAPAITSAISVTVGYNITATMPRPESAITVLTGRLAQLAGSLPGIRSAIVIDRPYEIAATLPRVASSIAVSTGIGAQIDARLAMPSSSVQCVTGAVLRINGAGPSVRSSFAVAVIGAATLRGGLPSVRSRITAVAGVGAAIHAKLATIKVSGMLIWKPPTIELRGNLPGITAKLYVRMAEQAVSIINFNLKQAAATRHESASALQCVAMVGGQVFAAGPGGVYRVRGDTDGAEAIEQRAVFGNLDFGTGRHKYAESCILEANATQAPVVTVHVDGAAYAYAADGPKRGATYRAKLGRGIKHKRLQFEVSGSGISDLESVEVLMPVSGRRF
jgi:hypothetical protein